MHPASQEDLKKRAYLNQIPSSDDEFDSQSSDDEEFQFNGEIQQIEQFQEIKFEEMSQELEARNRTPTTQLREDVNKVNFHIRENHLNTKSVPNPIKLLVSKQKRRYSLNGFNLDLTYITEKIIAMGFPAENLESVYRNSMQDVQRFFDTLHPGHYKIYNLCEERKYDHSNFKNMVKEFPFQDHQAPTFALIYDFCLDLDQWLKEHEKNVAGIHCKAGKGRTGVMICCYMLFAKQFTNALDSMRYYGMIRTRNKKGVTIPSQIRYIFYFEKALNNRWIPNGMPSKDVDLVKIKMIPVPKLNFMGGCTPWFRIQNGKYEYNSKQANGGKLKSYKLEPFVEFNLQGIYLKDDVLIQFFNDGMIKTGEKIFQAWFNCDFFDHTGILMIDKFMLDKACKDKSGTQFPKDFRIELHVVELTRDTKSIKQDIDSSMKQATIKKFQI